MARSNLPNLPNLPERSVPSDGLPAWVQTMRSAAMASISEDDIKEIIQNQVKKAKTGDAAALKFVFDQVLGGVQLRGATFVQNNYAGAEEEQRPDKPTRALPGSKEKLEIIRRRVEAGLSSTRAEDGLEGGRLE